MLQHVIIRDGWNLKANMLENIYAASNITSLLDKNNLILGRI